MRARFGTAAAALTALVLLGGCATDAERVSENLSKEAEQFNIERRIVFYNGITDRYMLEVTGRCAIYDDGGQLEVTCKVGDDAFKKHFLGLSDNVTYFAEQLETADVSEYTYKVIWKPETIIPSVDVETSLGEN